MDARQLKEDAPEVCTDCSKRWLYSFLSGPLASGKPASLIVLPLIQESLASSHKDQPQKMQVGSESTSARRSSKDGEGAINS